MFFVVERLGCLRCSAFWFPSCLDQPLLPARRAAARRAQGGDQDPRRIAAAYLLKACCQREGSQHLYMSGQAVSAPGARPVLSSALALPNRRRRTIVDGPVGCQGLSSASSAPSWLGGSLAPRMLDLDVERINAINLAKIDDMFQHTPSPCLCGGQGISVRPAPLDRSG